MSNTAVIQQTDRGGLSEELFAESLRVRPIMEKVADKWTVMILIVVCEKPARFNQIKRRLEGITHKALADALKRLERNGLVTRTVLPTSPIGVEYAITPLGLTLQQPFMALYNWALTYADAVEAAGISYDRTKLSA
jgi:DNA-binding HxlR family transcriptional regulator